MKLVRRLSLVALAAACLHLVFGAIVRISGSGMGCGDNWPKCYGYWIPPFSRPDLIVEVTHRYLPDGLRIAAAWGFRYQCLMTWNKHTGVVPFSWMYDTEHVIFATRGNLKVAKRGMRLSFDEPPVRDGHSTKPEVFYDRVRNASPEARLDMFARREHYGFDAWGSEAAS